MNVQLKEQNTHKQNTMLMLYSVIIYPLLSSLKGNKISSE